jgi:hypothetical protein
MTITINAYVHVAPKNQMQENLANSADVAINSLGIKCNFGWLTKYFYKIHYEFDRAKYLTSEKWEA